MPETRSNKKRKLETKPDRETTMDNPAPMTIMPPPKFSGNTEQDITEWLILFNRIARVNNWDGERKAALICCYLTGNAATWFTTQVLRANGPQTWDQWEEAMRSAFGNEQYRETNYHRLCSRKLSKEEDPEKYYLDIMRLCMTTQPDMGDRQKIRHLTDGLPEFMKNQVTILNPRTPEEFLALLQRLIRTQPMVDTTVNTWFQQAVKPPAIETRLVELVGTLEERIRQLEVRATPTNTRRDPRLSGRTETGQVVCYRCQRVGHIARNCRNQAAAGNGVSGGMKPPPPNRR